MASNKWIDSNAYLGPDRRRRPANKRWGDRRRFDETTEPPPLGALLRRLRVQMTSVAVQQDRSRALQLLRAAIAEAERQHLPQCADALKAADRILRIGALSDAHKADALITEAANHAGSGR
jgi:hypothetical protein